MKDRELLELAARAAGYEVRWHENWKCFVHVGANNITYPPSPAGQRHVWVPLDDDGDALRLAVQVRMDLEQSVPQDQTRWVCASVSESGIEGITEGFDDESQRFAATRRAIVLAAAAIGKKVAD
ncbi:TPA: hypothetical protein ACPILO_005496 [Pseudomonas aeruginosa]